MRVLSTQILLTAIFATLCVGECFASENFGQTHCRFGAPRATNVYGLVPAGSKKVALFLIVGLDGSPSLRTFDTQGECSSFRNISPREAECLWGTPLKCGDVAKRVTKTFQFKFLKSRVLQIQFQFEKDRISRFRVEGTPLIQNEWQQV